MTTYAGEVRIKTKLDATGINSGLSKVTATLGKLAFVVGAAFSVQAIVNFSKASVEAASKSETAWTGLGFVLNANNRSLTEAKEFLQEYTEDGLVPMTDAIKAYQNMVMRGYDTGQIEDMLRVMKDSAAFGRQGQYSMGEAIEKSTQGLRMENSLLTDSVGIQTNVAKMWQAYAKELGTTANNLTLVQKRQAEYNGFMKEGGIFAGAAAQYANTYAGRVSQLGTAFYNLRVAVGNAIIPILNQIIPVIIRVVNWFTRLFNIVGQVMNRLYGTNVSMADTASGAQDAADGTGEMADNLERAENAAKGSLAAFDKLNVLSRSEEGGGGGGDEGGGIGAILPVIPPPIESSWLGELENKLVLIAGLVYAIGAALLAWGISKLFGLDLAQTLGVMMITAGVVMLVTGAFDALENGVDWNNLILMVGGVTLVFAGLWLIAGLTVAAIGLLVGSIALLVIGINDWVTNGELTTQTFWLLEAAIVGVGLALAILIGWPALVVAAIVGLALAIAMYWDEISNRSATAANVIGGFFTGLWEGIKKVWGKISAWFSEHVVEPLKKTWGEIEKRLEEFKAFFTEKIVEPLKEKFGNLVEKWQEFAGVIKEKVIDPLVSWFQDWLWPKIQAVLSWIGTAFDVAFGWWLGLFTGVFSAITGVIQGALEIIGAIIGMIIDVIAGIITFLTGVFTGDWEKAWQGIKDIFGGIWDGIVGVLKGVINAIIGLVNGLINGVVNGINNVANVLNGLQIKIPDWVPLFGGNSFSLNIPTFTAPQIPYLATGAVIPANAPFAAILGDQRSGRNIETPEALLRQIMREEMRGASPEPVVLHNVLKLDSNVLYEAWNKESVRKGKSLLSRGAA